MMAEWVTDNNGNRCSVEYWGSRAVAKAALDSLVNCRDCTNCTNCRGCTNCTNCRGCEACTNCEDCTNCTRQDSLFKGEKHHAPSIPNIHSAVYGAAAVAGALDMRHWHHPCGTTHCRAGWVVTLAGDEGKELEGKTCTSFAAQMIYAASGYEIPQSAFYQPNDVALADMKRLAEKEADHG